MLEDYESKKEAAKLEAMMAAGFAASLGGGNSEPDVFVDGVRRG